MLVVYVVRTAGWGSLRMYRLWSPLPSFLRMDRRLPVRFRVCLGQSRLFQLGYRNEDLTFGQAKSGRKETVTITKFKEEAGVMMPGIWCKGHDLEGRVIHDMNEVDPEQNEVS